MVPLTIGQVEVNYKVRILQSTSLTYPITQQVTYSEGL